MLQVIRHGLSLHIQDKKTIPWIMTFKFTKETQVQQLAKGIDGNLLWGRHIKATRVTTKMHWSRWRLSGKIAYH